MRKPKLLPSTRGMLLLLLAALASCGGSSGGGATHDARSTVVVINNDAPSAPDDAGPPDALPDSPLTAASDAQASPDGGEITSQLPADAGSGDLWMDPSSIFPDCMTLSTSEEISDCIINLPTSIGVPVTRLDPMDYSACRP